ARADIDGGERGDRRRGGSRDPFILRLGQLVGAGTDLHRCQGRDGAAAFPGLLGELVGVGTDLHGVQRGDGGGLHRRNNRGAGDQGDGKGNGGDVHGGACLVLVISGVVVR